MSEVVRVQVSPGVYEYVYSKEGVDAKLVAAGGVVGPQGPPGPRGFDGPPGPQGTALNIDGGTPTSVYGGTDPIDGGGI